MMVTLKNNLLTVVISAHGAELQSIKNNVTGHEYLWQGDPRFWGRRSPVLFPIVGSLWEKRYRMDGKEYTLGQHGFARDCEFSIMDDVPADEAWFALEWNDETLKLYPRKFRLEIGYRLVDERITVMWTVQNLDSRDMAFQIGAHPAFYYPDFSPSDPVHAYLLFDNSTIESQVLAEKGCVGDETKKVLLNHEGMLPVTSDTFTHDALILADEQVHRVSMLDKAKSPYLSMIFRAPLVGLWSPKPDAPFMCIEPWYGRCDRRGYEGPFDQRDYVNLLSPRRSFNASYLIIIENL
ncbi:MAG: aldose 1-epimerase family protein [Clostridium sp.]|nr:aldose 1-epimerase family protein [Clostridium sp.]